MKKDGDLRIFSARVLFFLEQTKSWGWIHASLQQVMSNWEETQLRQTEGQKGDKAICASGGYKEINTGFKNIPSAQMFVSPIWKTKYLCKFRADFSSCKCYDNTNNNKKQHSCLALPAST